MSENQYLRVVLLKHKMYPRPRSLIVEKITLSTLARNIWGKGCFPSRMERRNWSE